MTDYTDLKAAAAYAAQDSSKFADESEELRALQQFHEEVKPETVLAMFADIERIQRVGVESPLQRDGTSPMAKLALVDDQVVGRVYHDPLPVRASLNSLGTTLPDNAPLFARPRDAMTRYARVPSRKDPKYHEEWPEIEGGPVFDGQAYCRDLFEALRLAHVILAETMPEGAVE